MLRRFGLWWLIALVLGLTAAPVAPPARARQAPITPQVVGFTPTAVQLRTVHVQGNYAYALSDYGNRIDIFSIADPTLPQ